MGQMDDMIMRADTEQDVEKAQEQVHSWKALGQIGFDEESLLNGETLYFEKSA